MWPFGSSSAPPAEDPNPLTRNERQQCWDSRDAYYACLDSAGVIEAGKEGKACAKENELYGKSCAQSWITYFNERRKLSFKQKDLLAQANTQNAAASKR